MNIVFVYSGNSLTGRNPIAENQAKSLKSTGVEIILFPIHGKGLPGYLSNTIRLRKFLRLNHCQILHAHYGLCGIVSNLARTNEKLIVSFLGSDLLGAYSKKKKVTFSSRILKILNLTLAKYRADFVVVKTEEMAKILKKGTQFSVIPNGVDIMLFQMISKDKAREILRLEHDAEVIIFVADSKRSEKNIDLAYRALEKLGREVTFIQVSGKPQNELPLYYSAADVLILTSLHEGSPNTIKEAMACNCPIVSTPVGDVAALVNDIPGCYISCNDPEDFANKTNSALNYAKNFNRTVGRERIIELGLDSESTAKRITEIYQKICKSC